VAEAPKAAPEEAGTAPETAIAEIKQPEEPANKPAEEQSAPAIAETEQPAQVETEEPEVVVVPDEQPATNEVATQEPQPEVETAAVEPEPVAPESSQEASETPPAPKDIAALSVTPKAPAQPEAPVEDPAPVLKAPHFDLVRADKDGSVLVAGVAQPGGQIEVLVNGSVETETLVGRDGKFVAFLDLYGRTTPSVLTLRLQVGDQTVLSEEEVIIAPVLVAQADPQPDPTPDPAPEPVPEPAPVAVTETADADPAPETKTPPAEDIAAADPTPDPVPEPKPEPQPEVVAQAPTILKSTAEGVEVLNTTPLPKGQVALDAISYDAEGDVQLSGRGTDDAQLQVYLDNAPVVSTQVQEGGAWNTVLPDVDSGTYTLRVDQVDDQGKVTARVESPFLRESAEALAKVEDQTQAVSVTVQPGHSLWAISRERYGDGLQYVKIYQANRDLIRNPDLIYPGQVFAFPEE
jgi:nucleoid-associated protein YgaU